MVFQKVCYDCGREIDNLEQVWRPKVGQIFLCKDCVECIEDKVSWEEVEGVLKRVEELGLGDVIRGRKVLWEN